MSTEARMFKRRGRRSGSTSGRRSVAVVLVSMVVASLASQIPTSPASAAAIKAAVAKDVTGIKVKAVASPARAEWTADDRELTEADLPVDAVAVAVSRSSS